MGLCSALNSAFLTPFKILSRLFIWLALLMLFGNFEAKVASYGAKYPKILFINRSRNFILNLWQNSDYQFSQKFTKSLLSRVHIV